MQKPFFNQNTVFSRLPSQVFMVHAIKAPMIKALETILTAKGSLGKIKAAFALKKALSLINKLPEPTENNTWHPNSHTLINIRDEYFKHCFLDQSRLQFIRILINGVIILYDFDPPYRMMMDWWIQEWQKEKHNWKPMWYGDTSKYDWPWWKP